MPVSVMHLPKLPAAAGKQHWGNLPGAAQALAIAEAASAARRFTLLLTADSQSAERLQEELSFFAPELPVLHFPDWETLPYDLFSPHQDIISQRIASLYRLPELSHGVLVVPVTTALHRLAPTKFLLGSSLVLDVGQKLDVEQMRELVRVTEIDFPELQRNVAATLAGQPGATVGDVLARSPATQGLASVVGLLVLALEHAMPAAGCETWAWHSVTTGEQRTVSAPRYVFGEVPADWSER